MVGFSSLIGPARGVKAVEELAPDCTAAVTSEVVDDLIPLEPVGRIATDVLVFLRKTTKTAPETRFESNAAVTTCDGMQQVDSVFDPSVGGSG
jgi:hypothetical protein